MATVTARDTSGSASKFVPIRPAFRPLLPRPASHNDTQAHEPTVVFRSQQQRRITKKRKEHQHNSVLAAAAVVAAQSGSSSLPATISPASLMQKRHRSPPGEDFLPPSATSSTASSPKLASTVSTPVLSLVDDSISVDTFSPMTSDVGTPLSLFNHVDDETIATTQEEYGDAGFDGVAGLTFDEFENSSYLTAATDPIEVNFFTSNMDMFS